MLFQLRFATVAMDHRSISRATATYHPAHAATRTHQLIPIHKIKQALLPRGQLHSLTVESVHGAVDCEPGPVVIFVLPVLATKRTGGRVRPACTVLSLKRRTLRWPAFNLLMTILSSSSIPMTQRSSSKMHQDAESKRRPDVILVPQAKLAMSSNDRGEKLRNRRMRTW
ncbi:hypothetical protein F5I97DRAFT_128208 [Phlebopus sp. FC_14]|nr:hypothetical protein F5I97DRAFT_128208 [Phlebopus sp. FC_14]